MSDKQASTIGSSLASCIAVNLTAQAAVNEWIARFPATWELDNKYAWFRPMVSANKCPSVSSPPPH